MELSGFLMQCPARAAGPNHSIPEVALAQASKSKLLHVVEAWLRDELERRRAADKKRVAEHGEASLEAAIKPTRTPFSMPSKHLAFFR